jgi:GntR family transcriptional regulator/MocR family aminotransferase
MTLPAGLAGLALDRRLAAPLYRQLYERIRAAILAGRLPPGTRLPATRSLAAQLAASRATVQLAYELLAAEGYVAGQAAAGTRVAALPDAASRRRARQPRPPPPFPGGQGEGPPLPFQVGLPALDAFPRKLWSRLAARHARGLSEAALAYQPPAGQPALRRAIQRYLAVARGIDCSLEQVLVTTGFQGAMGLLAAALLRPGDGVWVEDPGYFMARDALALAGARLVPVPVDEEGIDVAAGLAAAPRARLAVVTPAHQFPLGHTMSLSRRLALLAWAEAASAWIVEDDYDGEFRYDGRPPPALKSLDRAGRVIHAGTFGKVVFPGLRLGYLVLPEALVEPLLRARRLLAPLAAALDQATAADFLEQGHFARHVRRMRRLYAERRAALAAALAASFGPRLAIEPRPGGMHLLARPDLGAGDAELARRAASAGMAVEPLSRMALAAAPSPGLLLGFTNVAPEAAAALAARLRAALAPD